VKSRADVMHKFTKDLIIIWKHFWLSW
jgi:hypothetical protein